MNKFYQHKENIAHIEPQEFLQEIWSAPKKTHDFLMQAKMAVYGVFRQAR